MRLALLVLCCLMLSGCHLSCTDSDSKETHAAPAPSNEVGEP